MMKLFLCSVLSAASLMLSASGGEEAMGKKNPADFWKASELFRTPEFESVDQKYPDSREDGVQAITYSGLPLNGKPTKVFAYLGYPEGPVPQGGFPAVVLVHGGGGTAFAKYVRIWNRRGYAAIAMDLYGTRPVADKKKKTVPLEGGSNVDWQRRSVANAVLGHSLLRSMKNVNKDKIGLIGVSWGGIFASLISTVDDRLKFVIPVYGCGFFRYGDDSIVFYRSKQNRKPWWDPGYFLHASKVPVYWVDGTNDVHFAIPALERSIAATPTTANRTLVIRLEHSHIGFELSPVFRIVDSVLKNGVPLPKLGPISTKDGVASAKILNPGKGIRLPQLCYTKGSGPLSQRLWLNTPAKCAGGTISAKIPEGVTQYYLTAFDEKDASGQWNCSGSTAVVTVEK